MQTNILLIQPPIQDFYTTPKRLFPLGLLQIGTPLLNEGYNVNILDCHSGFKRKIIKLPNKFDYIRKYYDSKNKSPFRLFGEYYHFGMYKDEIRENIKKYNPDIVGISSNFSPYYETSLECAEIAKEVNPKITTVIGGTHASAMPDTFLKSPAVDYVIKGEADQVFAKLISFLKSKNASKISKLSGIINNDSLDNDYNIINNLDDLPFNNLGLILNNNYKDFAMLQTSRGCPLKCDFCGTPFNPGCKYREKSTKRVIEELLYYINNFGISNIDIEDDNFTADKKRCIEILELISTLSKLKISAMNGISALFLDDDILHKMKQAGFSKINLSLVSSNAPIRDRINRKGSIDNIVNIIKTAHNLGMEVETHFIIGIPEETPSKTLESLIYLSKLPTKIGGSIFYPVPGTPLFDKCIKNDWTMNKSDPSFWRLTLASTESYKNARTDQITFLYLVRIVNFVKDMASKYLTDKNKNAFSDIIKQLIKYKSQMDAHESLGISLLDKFTKEGIIYKAHKNKREYSFTKEDNLNMDLLSNFLSNISEIEY